MWRFFYKPIYIFLDMSLNYVSCVPIAYLKKKVMPSTIFFKCVFNTTTNGGHALFDDSLTNDSIGIIVNVPIVPSTTSF